MKGEGLEVQGLRVEGLQCRGHHSAFPVWVRTGSRDVSDIFSRLHIQHHDLHISTWGEKSNDDPSHLKPAPSTELGKLKFSVGGLAAQMYFHGSHESQKTISS